MKFQTSRSKRLDPDKYFFDERAAWEAVEFFPFLLRHIKGEWADRPFELAPWQQEIVADLMGTKRLSDGLRRYRKCYVEVPKKNGKSGMSSGIALLLLYADGESGAEIYSAAADRDQAGIVFGSSREMVEASPHLAKLAQTYRKEIKIPSTRSIYKVLSADVPTKHGLNPHGIIFDELHTQPNRELWDTLTMGMGTRRQPLLIAITTAGFDRNSICWEQHQYAQKILQGIIEDESFYPVIYAADKEDDWTAPATWKKANPNLGISVKYEYLESECQEAQELPGRQNSFKRLYLNIWTETENPWLDIEKWRDCGEPVDPEALAGRTCFGGLDLASISDLTCLELTFPPEEEDEPLQVLSFFWVPEEGIRVRAKRDKVPYEVWRQQGFIESTPGNVTDYNFIRQRIGQLGERFKIQEIAIDRWNASQLATQLEEDGLKVYMFPQTYVNMNGPSKELERLVLSKGIAHGGNPVLTWCVSNCVVTQDAGGNIKPNKRKSTEKIDGVVSLIMALPRAGVAEQKSIYEEQDIRFVGGGEEDVGPA